ncbi:hypothetical protein T484DRAFT_2228226 [Baffinella frigidus]|nr:hypothetical protein T484DRAFT_2228226 [Cryptophyta sp. CCMP2293]
MACRKLIPSLDLHQPPSIVLSCATPLSRNHARCACRIHAPFTLSLEKWPQRHVRFAPGWRVLEMLCVAVRDLTHKLPDARMPRFVKETLTVRDPGSASLGIHYPRLTYNPPIPHRRLTHNPLIPHRRLTHNLPIPHRRRVQARTEVRATGYQKTRTRFRRELIPRLRCSARPTPGRSTDAAPRMSSTACASLATRGQTAGRA